MSRIESESAITGVTVYTDRAFVTRSAMVELGPDVTEIIIKGLPAALDEYSFRAGGRGSAKVKISGIELQREFRGVPLDSELRGLREAITASRDRLVTLGNEKNLLTDRIKFFKETASAGHDDLSKTIARKRITVEEGGAIMDFYFDSIAGLTRRLEEKQIAMRLESEELEKLQKKWQQIESPRVLEGKSALVRVEVASPGDFTLEAAYVIFGAGWQSGYDIRFDSVTSKIRLEYKAAVMQQTGEPWDGVSLKLSTASPSSGANPPELEPVYLDFLRPALPAAAPIAGRSMKMMQAAADEPADRCMDVEEAEYAAAPEPMAAQLATATIQPGTGPSVTYIAPGRADIPPDGNPHLVLLSAEEFGADMDYILVPELAEPAYIRAKVVNTSQLVLLAGNTNIYRDDDFVGRGAMELVNPGAEFTCFLGADDRLRAKYDRKKVDTDSAGLTGGIRRLSRSALITIKSDIAAETKITVNARRPVARNTDIRIRSVKFSEKPAAEEDDGTLQWKMVIPAKGEQKISMEYSVEFPKDRIITGM